MSEIPEKLCGLCTFTLCRECGKALWLCGNTGSYGIDHDPTVQWAHVDYVTSHVAVPKSLYLPVAPKPPATASP